MCETNVYETGMKSQLGSKQERKVIHKLHFIFVLCKRLFDVCLLDSFTLACFHRGKWASTSQKTIQTFISGNIFQQFFYSLQCGSLVLKEFDTT